LLNLLIRYDAFLVAVQYLSFALSGKAYMGVGRNLSYKKDLFIRSKGFISHYKLKSGDDDLFVNQVSNGKNTRIEISPESHTISVAKGDFLQWISQKRRHLTTARHYRPVYKSMLLIVYVSKLFIYLTFLALVIFKYNTQVLLAMFLAYLVSQWIISSLVAKKFKENDLVYFSPVLEVVFLILSPVIYFSNMVIKQEQWK
jgi:hypothetical protein